MTIFTDEFKTEFLKRFKALLWHTGTMLAVGIISIIQENMTGLHIPAEAQIALGIVLAQITKWLNSQKSFPQENSTTV